MKPVPGILDISPYVGGRSQAAGTGPTYKMSSNESPLGPSARAIAAFQQTAASMHLYPESSCVALRKAIGDDHDDPKWIKTVWGVGYVLATTGS